MTAVLEPSSANSSIRKTILEHTRNIGIAAHIDAGKTTCTERVLFYSGVVHKIGEVHEGSATTDWMSKSASVGSQSHLLLFLVVGQLQKDLTAGIDHRINIIDTPGHEILRLKWRDPSGSWMVLAVFTSVGVCNPSPRRFGDRWTNIMFLDWPLSTKMDRMGSDFLAALQTMRDKLGANAHPLYLSIGAEENFKGLIDLVKMVAYIYDETDDSGVRFDTVAIPDDYADQAAEYRESLIEAVSDFFDDEIATKYLEGEEISEDELRLAVFGKLRSP